MKTWKTQIGSLAAGLMLAGVASRASAVIVTATTNAVSDTYIKASDPTGNNNATYLWFGNPAAVGGSSDTQRSLVGFNLSGIPTYATVTSATLSMLLGYTGDANSLTINAYKALSPWSESTSWNSFNSGGMAGTDYAPTVAASLSHSGNGTYWNTVSIDLSVVQGWVATPSSNNGLFLKLATESADYQYAFDREHGSPAYLTVTYEYAPEPSTVMLLVSGGLLLRWRQRL